MSVRDKGIELFHSSQISEILFKEDGSVKNLKEVYDFIVSEGGVMSNILPVGTTFEMIWNNDVAKRSFSEIASEMFSNINPNTMEKDISGYEEYSPYVPFLVLGNSISIQIDGEEEYFNGDGVISIADVLYGVASLFGSDLEPHNSIDGISKKSDYFNVGYNMICWGHSSYMCNLYNREDLYKPVTRCELAYIVIMCWNGLYDTIYYRNKLGRKFDWNYPSRELDMFSDREDYKVSCIITDNSVRELSLSVYRGGSSMQDYIIALKEGFTPYAMPLYMSLVEAFLLGLFSDSELNPLKEVTRGEYSMFLAKLVSIMYRKERGIGDE